MPIMARYRFIKNVYWENATITERISLKAANKDWMAQMDPAKRYLIGNVTKGWKQNIS